MKKQAVGYAKPALYDSVEKMRAKGLTTMGLHASWVFYDDPKRLSFSLSRYKFAARMLEGYKNVLECGCADGFGSRIVAQAVGKLTALDFNPDYIHSAEESAAHDKWAVTFLLHDMLASPPPGHYDGAYSMDVLEHIPEEHERTFLDNLTACLDIDGLCVIGMPSLQSQLYASALSKEGHVNCKDQGDFKGLMKQYFTTVLAFSMNDEVVHTGYPAMSHYNIMVCSGKRR